MLPASGGALTSKLSSGVATGWTGVDMPTPLLQEVVPVPEIDTHIQ